MNLRILRLLALAASVLTSAALLAQEQGSVSHDPATNGPNETASSTQLAAGFGPQPAVPTGDAAITEDNSFSSSTAHSQAASANANASQGSDAPHKLGSLTVSVSWR